MTKFDKAFKHIMESVKLAKESHEMGMTFDEDHPQIPVKDIIPGDTTGDIFILHGTATAEYYISPGQDGGYWEPSFDDEVEIEDVIWSDVVLKRDTGRSDDKYRGQTYDFDEGLDIVTPESIGQEYYDKAIQVLKSQGEEFLVKDVRDGGIDHAKDSWSP